MRRYVKVTQKIGGTEVTVNLVDGDLSSKATEKSYLGNIGAATLAANKRARRAIDEVRKALEPAS